MKSKKDKVNYYLNAAKATTPEELNDIKNLVSDKRLTVRVRLALHKIYEKSKDNVCYPDIKI